MNPVFRTFGRRTVVAVAALVVAFAMVHSQPVSAQTVDETWKFIQEMTDGKASLPYRYSGDFRDHSLDHSFYSKVDHQVSFVHDGNASYDQKMVFVLNDIDLIRLLPHKREKGLVVVAFQCKGGTSCISFMTIGGQVSIQTPEDGIGFTGSSAAERVLKAFQHLHKLALSEEKKTPF